MRKRKNEEEDVITAVMYDGDGGWKAKYAIDRKEYSIELSSLDAAFMRDTILKCKKRHGRLVAVPKGSAAQQSSESQLPQIPSSENGPVPGDLYNADAFCQRNCLLLAFRESFSTEKLKQFIMDTPCPAYLDETFANKMMQHLGIHTVLRDDLSISTEAEFKSTLMAPGTSWMLSPVSVNGYTGHTVILTNDHWFDSALECAKIGNGVDMRVADWPSAIDLAYDWNRWHCANVREFFLAGNVYDGYVCGCGVTVNREADAAVHNVTKRHKKWANWRSKQVC